MKDIIEAIDSRIKNPLFGYFVFAIIAMNWEEFFYLVVDISSVADRIVYFHKGTDSFTLLVYPFLIAAFYSVIYPWVQYLFMRLSTKPTELRNSLQAQSEHKLIIRKQELEDARAQLLSSTENELIERAKRDVKLDEIENKETRDKLKSEIDQLRNEREKTRGVTNKYPEKNKTLSKDQNSLLQLITKNGGSMAEKKIISSCDFDKVKTEYYLENMEEEGFLDKNYEYEPKNDYVYSLTTKSKKIMVDEGVVN